MQFPILALVLLALPAIPGLGSPQEPRSDQVEQPVEGLRSRTVDAFEGHTLITPLRSNTIFLLDMQGEVVHRRESEHPPGNSVYLQDDGRESRGPGCRGAGRGGRGGGPGMNAKGLLQATRIPPDHPGLAGKEL